MAVLTKAVALPNGTVSMAGMRLLMSPFSESGAAMQSTQPWVGNPGALSSAQIRVTGHLIQAAKANEGTYGTVMNPKTGKPMPKIAKEVKDYFETKNWTKTAEEKREVREAARRERKLAKHETSEFENYARQLHEIDPEAEGLLEGV